MLFAEILIGKIWLNLVKRFLDKLFAKFLLDLTKITLKSLGESIPADSEPESLITPPPSPLKPQNRREWGVKFKVYAYLPRIRIRKKYNPLFLRHKLYD